VLAVVPVDASAEVFQNYRADFAVDEIGLGERWVDRTCICMASATTRR
jgi:hypothetical protein